MLPLSHPASAGTGTEGDFPSGPLGLIELEAIALKNDPKLRRLRGDITVEEARKIVEKDWRDPELRVGRSFENDVELPDSYDERRVESSTDRVRTTTRDDRGRIIEQGTRTRTETTDLRVKPTPDGEIIRESATRRESTTLNGGRNGQETRTEVLQRDAYQERTGGPSPLDRDDDYSFRLRIYPPHPWERRARLDRAQARIELAQAELHTAQREVIIWVRRKYERLQFLRQALENTRGEVEADESYARDIEEMMNKGVTTRNKLGSARMDAITSPLAVDHAQVAYENELDELAARLGIVSTNRIHISGRIGRPHVPLDSRNLEYLIQMAFANRGELREIVSEGRISESALKVAKSKYIPWFSYMQFDYGINNTGGQRESDSYGFQLGITLPFFTWLGHQKAVHEAEIESVYSQMGAAKQQITAQVTGAYRALRRAGALKKRIAEKAATMRKQLDEAATYGQESVEMRRLKYDADRRKADLAEALLSAHSRYNEALIRFEEALGADISEVFNVSGLEASAAPMNKPPVAAPPRTAIGSKPNPKKHAEAGRASRKQTADKSEPAAQEKPARKFKLFNFNRKKGARNRPGSKRR